MFNIFSCTPGQRDTWPSMVHLPSFDMLHVPANHKHVQPGSYKPDPKSGKAPTTARDQASTIANATDKAMVQMGESGKDVLRFVADAIKQSKSNTVDTFVFRFRRGGMKKDVFAMRQK